MRSDLRGSLHATTPHTILLSHSLSPPSSLSLSPLPPLEVQKKNDTQEALNEKRRLQVQGTMQKWMERGARSVPQAAAPAPPAPQAAAAAAAAAPESEEEEEGAAAAVPARRAAHSRNLDAQAGAAALRGHPLYDLGGVANRGPSGASGSKALDMPPEGPSAKRARVA